MSTVDTKKLRELAEAATPGPWQVRTEQVLSVGTAYEHTVTQIQEAVGLHTCAHGICRAFQWHERSPDAAFIAAANPQTVIALLNEIEKLQKTIDTGNEAFRQTRDQWREQLDAMTKARDEAYAKGRADQVAAEHAKATDRWCDET